MEDEDWSEGPPTKEFTDEDLRDMKRTFHTLGISWEVSTSKPKVGVELENPALRDRLMKGERRFKRAELQNVFKMI